GVGCLPKKEVRQTHFARSANDQIGIGIVPRVEVFAEHLHINHCPVHGTQLNRTKQTLDAIDDFKTASIAQSENESQTSIASGLLDGFIKCFLRTPGEDSTSRHG